MPDKPLSRAAALKQARDVCFITGVPTMYFVWTPCGYENEFGETSGTNNHTCNDMGRSELVAALLAPYKGLTAHAGHGRPYTAEYGLIHSLPQEQRETARRGWHNGYAD